MDYNSQSKTKLVKEEYKILDENDKGYYVQFHKFNNKSIWIAKDCITVRNNSVSIDTWILERHIYAS